MQRTRVTEGLGWYGVTAIMAAYALVSFSVLTPSSLLYQGLNLTGALGIVIETWAKKDYQPFGLNLIWMGIALVAIVGMTVHST